MNQGMRRLQANKLCAHLWTKGITRKPERREDDWTVAQKMMMTILYKHLLGRHLLYIESSKKDPKYLGKNDLGPVARSMVRANRNRNLYVSKVVNIG